MTWERMGGQPGSELVSARIVRMQRIRERFCLAVIMTLPEDSRLERAGDSARIAHFKTNEVATCCRTSC